jgi:hypothetical protein
MSLYILGIIIVVVVVVVVIVVGLLNQHSHLPHRVSDRFLLSRNRAVGIYCVFVYARVRFLVY